MNNNVTVTKYQNNKSDFDFTYTPPTMPDEIALEFYTRLGRDRFRATKSGDNCVNCSVANGVITAHVKGSKYRLGVGLLRCEIIVTAVNTGFEDREQKAVIPLWTGIYLYDGSTGTTLNLTGDDE